MTFCCHPSFGEDLLCLISVCFMYFSNNHLVKAWLFFHSHGVSLPKKPGVSIWFAIQEAMENLHPKYVTLTTLDVRVFAWIFRSSRCIENPMQELSSCWHSQGCSARSPGFLWFYYCWTHVNHVFCQEVHGNHSQWTLWHVHVHRFFFDSLPPPPGPLVSKGPFQKIVSHLQKPLEFLGGYVYISFRGMILWLFRLLVSARFLTILCIGAKAITLAAWMMMQRQTKGEMGSLARKRFMSLEQINLTWSWSTWLLLQILRWVDVFFSTWPPPFVCFGWWTS